MPQKSGKQDTCKQHGALVVSLLWDVGQLACCSAPAPQLQWGFHFPVPQRDRHRHRAAKRTPSAFWPLSHDLSVGLHLQMESARVCPSDVLQKNPNLQLFVKQHPSAAFTGGQFSQVFEDERGKVSSLRSPAGIQPEERFYFFFPCQRCRYSEELQNHYSQGREVHSLINLSSSDPCQVSCRPPGKVPVQQLGQKYRTSR